MSRFRLSLRQKVIAVIVTTYLFLAFFFVFPAITFYHYLVEEELVGSAKVLARHVAIMSQPLIRQGDLSALRSFVGDVVRDSAGWVRYVVISDSEARVMAGAGPEELLRLAGLPSGHGREPRETVREVGERNPLWLHLFGHTFEVSLAVGEAGGGRVHLGISTASANRQMRKVILLSSGVALAAILLSAGLAWGVDRRLRISLSRLMELTRRMAGGDLSLRVDIRTGDELEELGHSFNQMADRLAHQHGELEARVWARTRELAETSDALKHIQTEQIRYERLSVLGEMTAVVSHEVRTPLNAMSIHVERLKRKLRQAERSDQREVAEILELIGFEVNRIQNVINNYMRFARPQLARPQRAEINPTIESVIQLLDPEAARSRIRVEFLPGADLPLVPLDEDKLRQVFLNLLLNGIQAMAGGGRILVETGRAEGGGVRARVSDTGPGIPRENLDKIFQPFFTTKPGGTGLGLAIVARIIREAGGEIRCRSEPGLGTELELLLPGEGGQGEEAASPTVDEAQPLKERQT